ncbi:MAG: hypothetical protein M1819_001793 [Sarea resinae]|nr:MAG: hypothetical protein M1819_001793 [Sarea resinae]
MPKNLNPSSSIIVIGAGTWGSSTALHLARRGYRNVTVFDPYPVPSAIAAGNDVNKIAEIGPPSETGEEDYVHEQIRAAVARGWLEDPVFKPYYHGTGYVVAAHSPAGLDYLEKREMPPSRDGFLRLDNAEAFRKTMPEGILTGAFPGWKGYYKKTGSGWVHAKKALVAAVKEAERLGVIFVSGSPRGDVKGFLYENGDVIGVETGDARRHEASIVILAAGANADQFLDFKEQLRPTAWTLAHIKMTEEEVKLYKNLPVLFNIEKGFFMEPDEDNHELKMCDEHPGYCNWITGADGVRKSIPFARHQIPKEAEVRMRGFLRDTMPQLADRPFSFARICWCADTPNREFLIDFHPEHSSLLLAVGGSGHAFKHIPAIGGFIVDALEGTLDPRVAEAFKWRPETAVGRDWQDTQGRFGGPNSVMDFQTVTGWTSI